VCLIGLALIVIIFRLRIGYWDPTFLLFVVSIAMVVIANLAIPRFIVQGCVALAVAAIYVVTITLLTRGIDVYLILKYARVILSFFSICVIIWFLADRYRHAISIDDIYSILAGILLLHPLVMLLQLLFPELNAWTASELPSEGAYHDERARGIARGTSSGGQILGLIALLYFWLAVRFKNIKFAVAGMLMGLLFPLSALAGAVPWVLGVLYWGGWYGARNVRSMSRTIALVIIVVAVIVGAAALIRSPEFVDERVADAWVRVGALAGMHVEPVSHGDPRQSLESLNESYSAPDLDAVGQWLFGNMHEKGAGKTFRSDAGLVRFLHVYGVIGTVIMLGILTWFCLRGRNGYLWLFLAVYIVLQIKNHMLFGRTIFDLFFVIFALSQLEIVNRKRAEKTRGGEHSAVRSEVNSV